MKTIKIAACAALLGTSVLTTPAMATPIPVSSAPDINTAQAECERQAPPTATNKVVAHTGSPAMVTGATSDTGNHTDANRRGDPASDRIWYSGAMLKGEVGRHGGSPNMFSAVAYDTKHYSNTLVDRTFETTRTDTYNFDCEKLKLVMREIHDGGSKGNNGKGNCVGDPSVVVDPPRVVDLRGPGKGAERSNENSACNRGGVSIVPVWVPDGEFPIAFAHTVLGSRGPVVTRLNEQFDEREGPYDIFTSVVVCISPSSSTKKGNPGEWRAQNGYSGANCNTAYYQTAPQLEGRRVDSTNSVPAS
ncbi:MAG TPA: hypothetical protein VM308_05585 [Sphingomicrobium sp.]|nr:hypothetical protein [Sphingomicrobium sp.]HVM37788.1 hypothetical protein [Sphingomicrobium sp.]